MSIATTVSRKARSAREFARGIVDTAHPLLVQIIPIRRCSIDCGYCNECDKVSPPVPTDVMKRRIDEAQGARHFGRRLSAAASRSASGPRRYSSLHPAARMMAGSSPTHFRCRSGSKELKRSRARLCRSASQHRARRGVKKSLRVLDKLQHLKEHAAFARQHQLGARRRDQNAGRCADDQPARELSAFDVHRHHYDGRGLLKPPDRKSAV